MNDDTIAADELPTVVRRAQQHDPDAWERLYRHCRPKLLRFALRRLSPEHRAEDAVSEAFSRAVARIGEFTWQGAGFDAWMFGIARNIVFESYRKENRHQALLDKQGGMTAVDLRSDIGANLEAAEERTLLAKAFECLTDTDREILELRVVAGLSADEVAEVLDKNPGAVRMAQKRALDRLRSAMKELEDA